MLIDLRHGDRLTQQVAVLVVIDRKEAQNDPNLFNIAVSDHPKVIIVIVINIFAESTFE